MERLLTRFAAVACASVLLTHSSITWAGDEAITLLSTGDTRGRVSVDRDGAGGLARRATLIDQARAEGPALLVDAGNTLFGGESLPTAGAVMVEAYEALDYDAVNLGYRDFRLGKAVTLAAIDNAAFDFVSANIYRADDERRLVQPFVVRERADRRWAVVGITERPAGMDHLAHLRQQLAGLEIRPAAAALREVLPEAREAADSVILLYYGSSGSLHRLLEQLDEAERAAISAVVAAGDDQADDMPDATPAIAWAGRHGAHVTRWTVPADAASRLAGDATTPFERLAVTDAIEPDEQLTERLAPRLRFEPAETPAAEQIRDSLPADAMGEPGQTFPLHAEGENRALRWTITGAAIHAQYQEHEAPPGMHWLVLNGRVENQMPVDLVFDLDYPEAVLVAGVSRQLFMLVNGTEVRRLAPDSERFSGHMPDQFTLMASGDAVEGELVFPVPKEGVESLSLRYYHDQYAPAHVSLLGAQEEDHVDDGEPVVAPRRNNVAEIGVYGIEQTQTIGDRKAPEGMRFVRVDVRGRGVVEGDIDARAVDVDAEADATVPNPRVLEYLYAPQLLQLVVDGTYGYTRELDMSTLEAEPPLLPDAMAGGEAVFLVPEHVESLELVCSFPQLRFPTIGDLGVPDTLRLPLEGEPAEPERREPLAEVEDEPVAMRILDATMVDRLGDREPQYNDAFLVLTVELENVGDEGGMLEVAHRFQVRAGDIPSGVRAVTLPPGTPLAEPMWLGAGQRRWFQVAVEADPRASEAELAYTGVGTGETVTFDLPDPTAPRDEAAVARVAAVGQVDEAPAPPPSLADREPRREADDDDDADDPEQPAEHAPSLASAPQLQAELAERSELDMEVHDPIDDSDRVALSEGVRTQVFLGHGQQAWMQRQRRQRVNVGLRELGAHLSSDSEMRSNRVSELNVGRLDRRWRLQPGTYELDLAGRGNARVGSVAFAVTEMGPEAKLTVQAAQEDDTWQTLATLHDVDLSDSHIRALAFDPVETDAIRFIWEGPEDGQLGRMRLSSLMAFEHVDDPADSVISRGGLPISRIEHGGTVFFAKESGGIGHLLTAPEQGQYIQSLRDAEPNEWMAPIILAFQANREALIESIELHLPDREDHRDHMPTAIRLDASRHEPFEGYERIDDFEIEMPDDGGPCRIVFPEPVPARFLRVQMMPPDRRAMHIGELRIDEGTAPGYASVLIRGDGVNWRHREQPTLVSLMGEERFREIERTEPGASVAAGAEISPNRWLGSTLDEPEQRHVYRFTVEHDPAQQVPELELYMAPFLRGEVRIMDEDGEAIETLYPGQMAQNTLHHTLELDPGTYLVEFRTAPIYLFLGFDSSGSMGRALPITREVLPELTDNLPEGVYVALGSSHQREGSSFTLYSEYTRDPEQLRHAITEKEINETRMLSTGGGSDWYNFLRDMLAWADEHVPADAIPAKVLVGDGVGRGDYDTMWDRLRQTQHRLYTVGWGSQTLRLDHMDTSTGWTAARGLFNAAWYRNGRYFEPQADHELIETYHAILDDVQTPAEYAMRIHVRERKPGRLATAPPEGENRPTLFVLDCSNSMTIDANGRTRLEAAIDVIEQMLESLPDDSHVGLRVFGHRYRMAVEYDRAAQDSELLIPIGPIDRDAFMSTLHELEAPGSTPMAYTIEQIPQDLRGLERPRVIILTDGHETFRRNPTVKSEALRAAVPDLEYAVVGFKIGRLAMRDNLRAMAEAGGGVYYNATDPDALLEAVEEALHPVTRFTVQPLEGQRSQPAQGVFGDSLELPEGAYELRAQIGDGVAKLPIRIRADRTLGLAEMDMPKPVIQDEQDPDAAAATDAAIEADRSGTSPDPDRRPDARSCRECGHELGEGHRFCTGCGAAVE